MQKTIVPKKPRASLDLATLLADVDSSTVSVDVTDVYNAALYDLYRGSKRDV